MIITLRLADFSKSNIGTLSSWRITRSLGSGATYEGVTSVDKGAAFTATVTLAEGYEIGTAGVTITMGGTVLSGAHSIEGNVITITIAEVTGNVLIKVPTINTATGEEDVTPDYTFTINPTPVDAAVTLTATGYTQSGNSITVPNGTTVSWRVSASGYTEQNGTWTANGSDETKGVELVASGGGETEKLAFIPGQVLYKQNGSLAAAEDWGYCATYFEVSPGGTVTLTGSSPTGNIVIFYDSDKKYVSGASESTTYTVPNNAALVRLSVYKNYFDTVDIQITDASIDPPTEGTYTFIEGQYLETINGKLTPNADWGYCETYLEVNAGDTLTVSGVSETGHSIILYNSNKIYVNCLANSLTYTIPDGVSFIRINCYKSYYTTISVQW